MTEEIILVHGTFAANQQDKGTGWWQVNSKFWNYLKSALKKNAHPTSQPFHWSGGNSDGHRHIAAAKLYERLLSITGNYHLVGHSHGGIVILYALSLAIEKGVVLDGLRSWTTIGTPFINHTLSWKKMILSDISSSFAGYLLGLSIMLLAGGIQGLFGPASQLIAAASFIGLSIVTFLCLLIRWIRLSRVATQLFNLQKKVIHTYGEYWLGLMSGSDEALGLLQKATTVRSANKMTSFFRMKKRNPIWEYSHKHTSKIRGLVPRIYDIDAPKATEPEWKNHVRSWFLSQILFFPIHIIFELIRFFYNQILMNWADRRLANYASIKALGTDSPFFQVKSVSSYPFGFNFEISPLPNQIETDLLNKANQGSKAILCEARRLLAYKMFVMPEERITYATDRDSIDPTSTLVHNLYFEVENVRKIICEHIKIACNSSNCHHATQAWIDSFKKSLRQSIDKLDSLRSSDDAICRLRPAD